MKEVKLIQKFAIDRLKMYIETTKKKKNISFIEELCNQIEGVFDNGYQDNVEEQIVTMIKLFRKFYIAHEVKSRRLFMLLRFIQTQIQDFDLLKSMGVSVISSDTSLITQFSKNKSSFFSALPNSLLNKPNSYNNFSKTFPKDGLPQEIIDDIDSLSIIYVTLGKHNPYGHSLIKIGDKGYLHINALYCKPQYMDPKQFAAYLKIGKCEVAAIQHLNIRNMAKAKDAIQSLSGKKRLWRITHHNCLSFTHAIAISGGVTYSELGCDHGTAKLPIDSCIGAKINPIYFDSKAKASLEGSDGIIRKGDGTKPEKAAYIQLSKGRYNLTNDQANLYADYRIIDGLPDDIAYATVNYVYSDKPYADKLFKMIVSKSSQQIQNTIHNIKILSKVGATILRPINTDPFVSDTTASGFRHI